jgi:hypothetical protein
VDLPDNVASEMQQHILNGAQRQADASGNFALMLQNEYASGLSFREANAARIVMEAGSGRTRGETNAPNDTSAGGSGTTPLAPKAS